MPTTWLDSVVKQTRRLGTFPYPHQLAFALDNPVRKLLADPNWIADRLDLTGSERLLEVGPGPGFFSVELARRLPPGHLELFDLQPQMLAKARAKLARAGMHEVGFSAGQADARLPYPDHTFDVAFLASVLGEVPDQAGCVQSLARVIKPGGRLIFFEGFPDPDRLGVRELCDVTEPQGFSFTSAVGDWCSDVIHFVRR